MIPTLIATRYITPLRKGGSQLASHSFDYTLLRLAPPRSTALQVSTVHCGLCTDPQAALNDLFERLVARPTGRGVAC